MGRWRPGAKGRCSIASRTRPVPRHQYGVLTMLDRLGNDGASDTLLSWVSRPWWPWALTGQEVQHGD